MNLNWGVLKFQLENQFGENIKITQIQPRFVLKFTIRFKFDMTWTGTGDTLNCNSETDLEKKKWKWPKQNPDLFRNS